MFHLVVGFLLPTLLLAWCWQPPAGAAGRRSAARGSGSSAWQRADKLSQQAVAGSDRLLCTLFGGAAGLLGRTFVAWYLLSKTWLLCSTRYSQLSAGL